MACWMGLLGRLAGGLFAGDRHRIADGFPGADASGGSALFGVEHAWLTMVAEMSKTVLAAGFRRGSRAANRRVT